MRPDDTESSSAAPNLRPLGRNTRYQRERAHEHNEGHEEPVVAATLEESQELETLAPGGQQTEEQDGDRGLDDHLLKDATGTEQRSDGAEIIRMRRALGLHQPHITAQ